MPPTGRIDTLLADLGTLLDIASAGITSKSETRLEAGEVRPAAILFIDVVGFSTISRRLTPEQLSRLIDSSFRIFELTAKSFGGYLDKVIGDAGLYVFAGHPNYEPPCEAALSAALKIQERAAQISQSLEELELSLPVRCGVSFGEVARQAVGGADVQITVMGDTVNLAQRLEASAVPGTVLTHGAVIKKAGALFEYETLGTRELKGVGEHTVYQVVAQRPRPAALRGSYGQLSPFTGREEQLESALARIASWAELDYGTTAGESGESTPAAEMARNRLLVVRGEPAIGKSRFALEVIRQLPGVLGTERPLAHATAHCSEYATLLTFTAELARVAGLTADNLIERWEELCQLAAAKVGPGYAERKRRNLQLLAYVLGARGVDTSAVRQSGAHAFETGCRLAVRACCELAALDGSRVVLVLEDVQWLRNLRELITEMLVHTRLAYPLVVIATARPEFDCGADNLRRLVVATAPREEGAPEDSGTEISGELPYSVVDLPLLGVQQGAELMQRLLPGVQLPAELQAELHAKARGLPYYYEEFARMLADSGMSREVTGELTMPVDIRMLLLGRLDMLTPRAKDLAMRASVLGRIVTLGLLSRVERRLELDSGESLSNGLAELEEAGILIENRDGVYMFEHLLTRDAAYGSLLNRNRRLVHGAVADVLLEDLAPGSVEEWEILPQLIDHLERGERFNEAHDRCCELMIIQAKSGRTAEWDKWEARAMSLRDRLAEEPEGAQADEALYLRAVGVRQLMHSELAAAKENFTQALDLALRADDYPAMVSNLGNLAMIAHREKEYKQAISILRKAIEISLQQDLEEQCGTLYANLGTYYTSGKDHEQALKCYEKALKYHERFDNIRGTASVQVNLGRIQQDKGDLAEANASYSKALELSQRLGDRLIECVVRMNLVCIQYEAGQLHKAKESLLTALEASREISSIVDEQLSLFNLGEVSFDLAEYHEAESYYREALSLACAQVDPVWIHCALGRTLAALEQFDAALAQLNLAARLENSAPSASGQGVIDACRAYYYLQQGELATAETFLTATKAVLAKLEYAAGSQLAIEIGRAQASWNEALSAKTTQTSRD